MSHDSQPGRSSTTVTGAKSAYRRLHQRPTAQQSKAPPLRVPSLLIKGGIVSCLSPSLPLPLNIFVSRRTMASADLVHPPPSPKHLTGGGRDGRTGGQLRAHKGRGNVVMGTGGWSGWGVTCADPRAGFVLCVCGVCGAQVQARRAGKRRTLSARPEQAEPDLAAWLGGSASSASPSPTSPRGA